jgi:pyruvate/2-oxoglutarate dehydrogenase complex dihydrolipoamide acyltransferase (E2) component
MYETPFTITPFSRFRNFVLDIMTEGRKKNIVHMIFEADITEARQRLQEYKKIQGEAPSLTSFVLRCYAKTIDENHQMNSYRRGKKELMVFDEVDVSVMVEKAPEGESPQPIHYIIRNANHKSLDSISEELKIAKNQPFEEMVTKLDQVFFGKTPTFLRKLVWWIMKKDPKVKKQYSGTVGFTSIGMFGSGTTFAIPITPMTTTIAMGTIVQRPMLINKQLVNRDFLCLTLACDHEIIDGAPMMRFIMRMRELIENCFEIPDLKIEQAHAQTKDYLYPTIPVSN